MAIGRLVTKFQLVSVGVSLALVATACGGSSSSSGGSGGAATAAAANCTGDPVKIMTITTLSGPINNFAGLPAGAQAAAKAVNSTCELGRPVEIVSCDDQFSPNGATACGRKAVEEKVVAVAFTFDQTGDSYMPILENAGIPVFSAGASPLQNSSAASFPVSVPIPAIIAHVTAAAATGAKKIAIAHIDVPAVQFYVDIMKQQITKNGLTEAAEVPLAPTATDMTQYAGQVLSSGADAVIVNTSSSQTTGLIKALKQQGADLSKLRVIQGSATMNGKVIETYPDNANGVYLVGTEWPTTDTANQGVAQFRKELQAASLDSSENHGDLTLTSWSMVHVIADSLKGGPLTATALMEKSKTLKINRPEMAPFDFSMNAFPDDPVLSKFRLFTNQALLSRVQDGKAILLSDGFFNALTVPKLRQG